MKTIKTLIFIAASLISFDSNAKLRSRDEGVYITEKTYIRTENTAYRGCMNDVGNEGFCSCAASVVIANMKIVVEMNSLVMEKELFFHIEEIRMSENQFNTCQSLSND
jgi:hypothetical protein